MTSSRSDDAEDKAELFIPSIGFQCSLTDLPEPRGSFPYMFGGNVEPAAAGWGKIETADIMAWDDRTKEWSKVGVMKEARRDHGVSAIEVNWATLNACKP